MGESDDNNSIENVAEAGKAGADDHDGVHDEEHTSWDL